jgi:hypothetical protein
MAEDAKRLLSLQMAYERELGHKFLFAGLSVNDFIYTLLCEGLGKRAEKVRADWRVPDKRFVLSSFYLFSSIHLFLRSAVPALLPSLPSYLNLSRLRSVLPRDMERQLTPDSGGSRLKLLLVTRTGRDWKHLRDPRNRQLVTSLSS